MVLSAVDAVDVHSVESRQVRRLCCDRHVESQTQLSVRAISPHVNAPVVADAGAVEAAACDRHHRKALEQGQSLWLTHISDGAQSELSVISSAPCDDLSVVGQTESVSRSCCQLNRETERNGEQTHPREYSGKTRILYEVSSWLSATPISYVVCCMMSSPGR